MVEIRVDVQGLERIRRFVSDPQAVAGPIRTFLQRASATVERKAKEFAPVDTGRLRSSIRSSIRPLEAEVATNVAYAPYVEFGTRPHMPPVLALALWAGRHGFKSPWPLAMAIARRGTKPHPFMGSAAEQSRGDVERFLDEAARELENRWAA